MTGQTRQRKVNRQNVGNTVAMEEAQINNDVSKLGKDIKNLKNLKSNIQPGVSSIGYRQMPLMPRAVMPATFVKQELKTVKKKILQENPGLKAGKRMALAVVLPHAHTARYVAGWANTPTSVASPYVITTTDFSKANLAGLTYPAELQAGAFFAAVSRDPLNAIIEYVPNPDGLALEYEGNFCTYALGDAERTPIVGNIQWFDVAPGVFHVVTPCFWKDLHVGASNYIHPHGSRLYTKLSERDSIFRFTYLTKGQTVRFDFVDGTGPGTTTGAIGVVRANGDSYTETTGVTVSAATSATVTAAESGYYAFTITWSSFSGSGQFGLTAKMQDNAGAPNAIGSYLGMRPIPGIEDRSTLAGIRVNGCSIMITPDSAALAKGGRITGAQLNTDFRIESVVKNAAGLTPNEVLDQIPDSVGIDFEKGGYAFHKPRTSEAFKMHTPFKRNDDYSPSAVGGFKSPASTVSSYHSNIYAPDGWLGYAVTTPAALLGGASAPYPGGLAHVTYSFSVEYFNYDVWIPRALAPAGPAEFDDIMKVVSTARQYHENPLHVKDLQRWYNGAMPVLRKLGPGVAALVTALFPELAPSVAALGGAASLLPERWE